MYEHIPDYTEQFEEYEARLEDEAGRLPKCECCGERITTEKFFNIEGTYICPTCINDFIVNTDEYLEDKR